jgi:hypothetical protein
MNAAPSPSPLPTHSAWHYACLGAVLLSVGFLVLRPPTSSALPPAQEPGQELSQEPSREPGQKPSQIKRIAVTPQLPATDRSPQQQSKSQLHTRLTLEQYTRCLARQLGLDETLAVALLIQESDARDPMKPGSRGSRGPLQIGPVALEEVGLSPSEHSLPVLVYGGLSYLKSMLTRFADRSAALAAYNMGPTILEERQHLPYIETRQYVRQVLQRTEQLRSGETPFYPVLQHRISGYSLGPDSLAIVPLQACLVS